MIRKIVLMLALLAAPISRAADALPQDVRRFVRNAETCEHVAGEWDSELPESRRREISRAVDRYCAPAKRQLPLLTRKYRGNRYVSRTISKHAYDSVKSYSDIDDAADTW